MICAIAVSGCTSSTDSLDRTPVEGEPMNFTLGSITRLTEKSAWAVGDRIAIYRNDSDDTAPRLYTINDSGDLTSEEGWDYSYEYSNYRAIYPYKDETTTYEEYIDALPTFASDDETDYLITNYATAESQTLELIFSHAYAKITITDTGSTTGDFTATITADGDSKSEISDSKSAEFTLLAGDYTDNLTMSASILDGVYEMTITPNRYIYVGGVDYEVKITIE